MAAAADPTTSESPSKVLAMQGKQVVHFVFMVGNPHCRPEIIFYVKPVSYTHLDVYKRQVFYCSDLSGDHRLLVWLEHSLFLSVDRDVKLDGTIGAAEFLGEVQLPGCGRRLILEPSKLCLLYTSRCV